jgi:hypothetical protein
VISYASESTVSGKSYDRTGGDLFEKGWDLNKL